MADPLSAAAGIIGILTAAVQISKLLIEFTKRTKDAPRQAGQVLSEVNDVHTIMTQLQAFLLGLDTQDQSQSCHVQVESLLSVLTGCVATFSDLERLLDQMRSEDLTMLDRLKWAKKESTIEVLISRLQVHKTSLTLMLEIFNGSTMQDVKTMVSRLDKTMSDNYQEILSRFRALEMPPSTSQRPLSCTSTSDASAAAGFASPNEDEHRSNPASQNQRLSKVFNFMFESELAISKVYRKVVFGGSTTSLQTTDDPKTSWSVLSASSIADVVSNLSVLNLAITTAEVYNADHYRSGSQDLLKNTSLNPTNKSLRVATALYSLANLDVEENRLMDWLSAASNDFFLGLDSSWTESSRKELIRQIYMSLNLPLSMMESRWNTPTFFMSFGQPQRDIFTIDNPFSWRALHLSEEVRPLQLFAYLRAKGWQPILLLSVSKQPYYRRNKRLKLHEVLYTLDGWVIDAELFRLSMAHMQRLPVNRETVDRPPYLSLDKVV